MGAPLSVGFERFVHVPSAEVLAMYRLLCIALSFALRTWTGHLNYIVSSPIIQFGFRLISSALAFEALGLRYYSICRCRTVLFRNDFLRSGGHCDRGCHILLPHPQKACTDLIKISRSLYTGTLLTLHDLDRSLQSSKDLRKNTLRSLHACQILAGTSECGIIVERPGEIK